MMGPSKLDSSIVATSEVESTASPREQGQIVLFMRDMRKHLTGS